MTLIDPELDFGPVVDSLVERFATVADRHQINDLVAAEAARFSDARIREYVPILVQHRCADRLRQLVPA